MNTIEDVKKALSHNEGQYHKDKIDMDEYVRFLLSEVEHISEIRAKHELLNSVVDGYEKVCKQYSDELDQVRKDSDRIRTERNKLINALIEISEYPPFEETNNGDRFYRQARELAEKTLSDVGVIYDEEMEWRNL